jgi:uncharacterized protein (TIGR00730 family)
MDAQYFNEHDIRKNQVESLARIFQEFKNGFDFIKRYPKSVSVMGSARFAEDHKYSLMARELARRIAKECGYAVVTGGGPGIMEAANRGAHEAGGVSLGISIKLPKEQHTNPWVVENMDFSYFFTRKTVLTFAAEAYVVFPGGYGTFDEFFEVLTLIQTKKIPAVPIILIGSDFWTPLVTFIKEHMLEEDKAINPEDLKLYTITDNLDEAIDIIKRAPIQRWWKNIER